MRPTETFVAWVTFDDTEVNLNVGVLPGPCFVLTPYIGVTTLFNAGSSNQIKIGTDTDDDAFGQAKSVGSAFDYEEFTAGTGLGYRAAGTKVVATYVQSGSAPTTGEAIVILPFIRVPRP